MIDTTLNSVYAIKTVHTLNVDNNIKTEMEKYINNLEQNTNKLLETVKDYSIDNLTKKSGSEWSVLEILEHIYKSDKIIYSIISKPSDSESKIKEILGRDKLENILVAQRNKKVQSPNLLLPNGRFQSLIAFNSAFLELRKTLKRDLATKKLTIDNRIHNHPLLGEMTITDWLNFILFHTERHLKQIKEKE